MTVVNGSLELILTDKQTGEEWECNYDVSYVENLTRKTGNFKQFEIFIAMIRSGLLKTSECISMDLLTYEDLEAMRIRRIRNHHSTRSTNNCNRRYLIITYSVEFDKINYPLPLEYCGFPDPIILQDTIRRLELELGKANEELEIKNSSNEKGKIRMLQNRVDVLTSENKRLHEEIGYLTKMLSKNPKNQVQTFQKTIEQIEKNLVSERKSHHKLLEKLQNEKMYLANQLERLKDSERSLKNKLQEFSRNSSNVNRPTRRSSATKSCEPHANIIFSKNLKKKSSTSLNKKKNAQVNPKSRSASPQIENEDVWKYFTENIGQSISEEKPRSRSSSISTAIQSNKYNFLGSISSEGSPVHSGRQSRRQSPHSGRSSVQSFNAGNRRNINASIPSPIRSRPASPELARRFNKLFINGRRNGRF